MPGDHGFTNLLGARMTAVIDRPNPPHDADTVIHHPIRRRVAKRHRPWKRIWVHTVMLISFVASFATLLLGNILFHVVAGLVFAAVAVVHVKLNRKWVSSVLRRRLEWRGIDVAVSRCPRENTPRSVSITNAMSGSVTSTSTGSDGASGRSSK